VLGISEAKWVDFPEATKQALFEGLVMMGASFNSQEISIVIYGY